MAARATNTIEQEGKKVTKEVDRESRHAAESQGGTTITVGAGAASTPFLTELFLASDVQTAIHAPNSTSKLEPLFAPLLRAADRLSTYTRVLGKNRGPHIPIRKKILTSRTMRFFVRRTPKTPTIVLQNLEDGATPTRVSHKQPSWWSRIRSCFESLLPKLRLPVAVLIGANITAFTTFALVRHVQHEIANAKVGSDPNKWMQIARTEAYDACYYGCNDCGDTDWAYNACKMTARANVTGVICDGSLMWNWAARYPTECLKAIGELYQAEALRKLKQTYRNQLAVIILTVLAGIIGAVITCKIWSCIAARCQARARSRPSGGPSRYQAAGNEPSPPPYFPPRYQAAGNEPSPPPYFPPRIRGGGSSAGRSAGRIALITTAFASIVSRSRAYPCTGHNPIADQYFINANKTLYGVVHGWFSNCYDYLCDCTTSCFGSSTYCSTTCNICTASVAPIAYVNTALWHVKACGFEPVDAVDGAVNMRVANPLIEKKWWVKISVNEFNLTDVTDPSIFCLHDFANN